MAGGAEPVRAGGAETGRSMKVGGPARFPERDPGKLGRNYPKSSPSESNRRACRADYFFWKVSSRGVSWFELTTTSLSFLGRFTRLLSCQMLTS